MARRLLFHRKNSICMRGVFKMISASVSSPRSAPLIGDLAIAYTFAEAEIAWRALERTSVPAPFQTFDWCRSWWTHIGARTGGTLAIVIGRARNGRLSFIVPLIVTSVGGLRIARLLGDRHSASRGGLFDRDYLGALTRLPAGTIITAIGNALNVSVMQLQCMPLTLDGVPHPLLGPETPIRRGEALSIAHLNCDWDAFDADHRSGETRRKERRNEAQLAKLGPVKFVAASTPKVRARLFNAMVAQKSAWLAARQLPNFFSHAGVPGFLRAIADTEVEGGLNANLVGLQVGDKVVAVSFGVIHGTSFSGMIMSAADGPAHKFAPGALLLTKCMRHHAEAGIKTFCFGAVAAGEGANDWKARWCDATIELADITVPLTPLGRAYHIAAAAKATAAAHVRSQPTLLKLARQTRSAVLTLRSDRPAASAAAV